MKSAKKPEKPLLLRPLALDAYALTSEDIQRFDDEAAAGMVLPHDPVLVRVATPVDVGSIGTAPIRLLTERLLAIARGQQAGGKKSAPAKGRMLVGLSAPQIGESVRIIVVDTKIDAGRKKPGRLECFINPVIIWHSRETAEGREGCFSAGLVWGLVRRPIAIKLQAITPDGKRIERIFEDFTARIVQHEIDHLDGIRFPERIRSDYKRHWVHTEELKLYVKQIQHWQRTCTLERWEALKRGKIEA
ncbi:MAG TPA: peptide deformylase [Candidatus Saccharimonadales bacterium]|nr:peptide deformylase [Candidatus Saccharimonadales bacterium]